MTREMTPVLHHASFRAASLLALPSFAVTACGLGGSTKDGDPGIDSGDTGIICDTPSDVPVADSTYSGDGFACMEDYVVWTDDIIDNVYLFGPDICDGETPSDARLVTSCDLPGTPPTNVFNTSGIIHSARVTPIE